jgi:prolyl-tRNA editing enzyme YbaK/EbsC (Cys-tRNA(Pro) deacylase)
MSGTTSIPEISGHPAVTRVRQALAAGGAHGEIRVLEEAVRTAVQAAEHLGVEVGQIANSLVFEADGQPLLVLASGIGRVDLGLVAAAIGAAKVRRADPDVVRAHTGFVIGGVAPVGHLHPITTVVDTHLGSYDVVWAAGGHPHTVFPTSYDELCRLTGGTPATVR